MIGRRGAIVAARARVRQKGKRASEGQTISESSYAGNWHGSGQIPARAVEQGAIGRFGSIDPSEGGNTARHQLALTYKIRPTEESEISALAYVGTYRFNLFSNFTLYLNDADNGDEIEQVDRRTFYGTARSVTGSCTSWAVCGSTPPSAAMFERRHPRRALALPTAAAKRLNSCGNDVAPRRSGAYVNEEVTPAPWLTAQRGGHGPIALVRSRQLARNGRPTNPQSGVDAAHQFSPKASLITTPIDTQDAQLESTSNYGHGFHSNDVRGVFTTPSVTPLDACEGAKSWSASAVSGIDGTSRPPGGFSISTMRRLGAATKGRRASPSHAPVRR